MTAPVLVLKFGGAALGSPARLRRAAARVRAHAARGRWVVAVVSARGDATDRLLRAAAAVARGGAPAAREVDRVLATGEDLSAALLAAALSAAGVAARSLRGGEAGIAAEGPFGAGAVAGVDPGPVLHLFRCGVVPVVSGFQGAGEDGETRTLGRGGSDLTAVALAAALGRVPCHLVKDVPAVFDRDPRLDPAAVPLRRLDHAGLLEIAARGGQVVHAEAARLALSAGVPLRVYHYAAPLSGRGGTVVRAPALPRVPVEAA